MDGLRGIAMLFVFIGHFGSRWTLQVQPSGRVAAILRFIDADATLGSSFFMLLSGFFAYSSLLRGQRAFGDFMAGRLRRLYPLYLTISAAYILGFLAFPSMSRLPAETWHAVLYVAANLLFLQGVLPIEPIMEAAWTISFIVLFYFIDAGVVRLFKRLGLSTRQRIVLLAVMTVVWSVAGYTTGRWPPRTCVFWVGMAFAEVAAANPLAHGNWTSRAAAPAALIALFGVAIRTELMLLKPDTGIIPLMVLRSFITSVSLFAFMWVAYFGPEWWKRLLAGHELRTLGATSYSFYLTHGFSLKVFRFGIIPLLGPRAHTPLVFGTSLLLGLALAIWFAKLVFDCIENPLANRVRVRRPLSIPATAG
jgi:peptidoglycan/LPS O-acetylase OafA/YrhL